MKYQILSPDGISIENIPGYPTLEAAKNAFNVWKKRFKNQGYYSSNEGRIELVDLEECCTLIEL